MVEKSRISGFRPPLCKPFARAGQRIADRVAPASRASSADDACRISVALPGVSEDDIEVTAQTGVVTLKGKKRNLREEKGETWYFSERQYRSFSRSFRRPPDADAGTAAGSRKDGVPTVAVPGKAAAADKGSRMSIGKV